MKVPEEGGGEEERGEHKCPDMSSNLGSHLSSCVTLGKFLSFSDPLFILSWQMEMIISIRRAVVRMNERMYARHGERHRVGVISRGGFPSPTKQMVFELTFPKGGGCQNPQAMWTRIAQQSVTASQTFVYRVGVK